MKREAHLRNLFIGALYFNTRYINRESNSLNKRNGEI
jgi:hypothetical protein